MIGLFAVLATAFLVFLLVAASAVTRKLSVLDKPSADDRRLLAEARTTIANLEGVAT